MTERTATVFINTLEEGDEMRKGGFPSVQIYPIEDNFEVINEDCHLHKTKLMLIVTTKGPRDVNFERSILYVTTLYDHIMSTRPRLKIINTVPTNGKLTYAWETFRFSKHRNLELSHSSIELTYEWRTP